MIKSFPFFLLLTNILLFPLQAGATETASSFKTGEYRICLGTEAECLQGNGEVGKEYVRFEKNGMGHFAVGANTTLFRWRKEGDAVVIDSSNEALPPYKLEVKAGSALLRESDEVSYLLIEDEDMIFRTGMYYRCPENTEASCLEGVEAFMAGMPADEEPAPADFLTFEAEDSKLYVCPRSEPGTACDELVWKRADAGGEVDALKASGEVALRFTEDKNMLVDKSSGARYLRAASEAVMNSAN